MITPAIRQAILVRSLWMRVSHPHLSREQARDLAAAEIAQEQAERARREPPRSTPRGPRDARTELIGRVAATIGRLLRREPDLPPATATDHRAVRLERASAPLPQPPPRPRPSIGQRVRATFERKPEPEPPRSPTIRAENSNATLIPDSEFSPRFRDPTTANWRRSIEDNERLFDERRGRVKSGLVP
jgi:hypothetical protein